MKKVDNFKMDNKIYVESKQEANNATVRELINTATHAIIRYMAVGTDVDESKSKPFMNYHMKIMNISVFELQMHEGNGINFIIKIANSINLDKRAGHYSYKMVDKFNEIRTQHNLKQISTFSETTYVN